MKSLFFVVLTVLFMQSSAQVCLNSANVSPAVNISGQGNFAISGLRISGNGNLIKLTDCYNVTISNCILGPSLNHEAIVLDNCLNVTVTNCLFKDNGNGVLVNECSGGIKIIGNQFSDVQFFTSRGQFIQFSSSTGPGNEISDNVGENIWGSSSSEDLVNIYKSSGTASSPILIQRNRFRGGGPGAWPDGHSCGGIMTGDSGGGYVIAQDNILSSPGQYGIAISSGSNISLLRNKVYAPANSPNISINNIGMYVSNFSPNGSFCGYDTIEDNVISYYNKNGSLNPFDDEPTCSPVYVSNNDLCTGPPCSLSADPLLARLLCPELSAYYNFDTDWWTDQTGSGLTLTSNNSYVTQPCDGVGGAANFNGLNEYLSLPVSPWLAPSSQKFSVSCWIKPTDISGIKAIARSENADGWDNGWRILLIDGNMNARITTSLGAFEIWAGGITPGVWNHISVTYDGTTLKGYVNGVLENSTSLGGKIVYSTSGIPMTIGFSNGDYYFNGQIDEFKFYSGDLTADEILQDYNTSSVNFNHPRPFGLALYYTNNGTTTEANSTNVVYPGLTTVVATNQVTSDFTWQMNYGTPSSYSSANETATFNLDYNNEANLTVTATTPCGGTASQTVDFVASLYSLNSQESYNPSVKAIDVHILSGQQAAAPVPISYKLFNITGQLVRQGTANSSKFSIDAWGLALGVYILHMNSKGSNSVKKVLLQ